MYRMNLFGAFSLTGPGGVDVPLTSARAKALLAYLSQSPGMRRSRVEIMTLLWSDRAEAQARASLRQVLHGLRKELGERGAAILQIDADWVGLAPGTIALGSAEEGEFLSGLQVNDPAFDEWLRDTRLRSEDDDAQPTQHSAGAVQDRPVVAVLPFANLSEDPEQQYFADGITEDIITELARFQSLWVIGRSSSFAFADMDSETKDPGRQLGVGYVVEGSVRRAGERLRVTAQLVEATSGKRIWAERYDRMMEDVFAVQDEIAASVVAKLSLSLDGRETALARNRPHKNLSAYDLLLRSRSAWWHGNDSEAYQLAGKSVNTDTASAVAHAYFSLQNAYQFYSGSMGLSLDEIARKCQFHAEAALAMDDTDPIIHAYVAMAFAFSPLGFRERGLKHAEIAGNLNPNDCEIMLFHAWNLAFAGRTEEALVLLRKAGSLNPLGGYMISACYADTLYMSGDYVGALDSFKGWAEAPPSFVPVLAASLAQLGRLDEAKACLAELERVKPEHFSLESYARAQCFTCHKDEDRDNWRRGFELAGIKL
jgi:TolB-like protein